MHKAVQRLERKGYLIRVGRQLYANRFGQPMLEALAMILGAPCYISFESGLERYGILSQVPLVLTCASTSRSERRQTPLGEILFHRLRPALFFGYRVEEGGVLWAEPEKALLDWIYIHRKQHGVTVPLDELNWEPLDVERLQDWARHYPHPVRAALKGALEPAGGESHTSGLAAAAPTGAFALSVRTARPLARPRRDGVPREPGDGLTQGPERQRSESR